MVTNQPPRPFRGMRRLTLTGAGTATVLVLLFSYRTSTGESASSTPQSLAPAQVVAGTSSGQSSGNPPGGGAAAADVPVTTTEVPQTGTASSAPAASSTSQASTATSAATAASVTVDGAQEMTRYGVVQVRVTITDGHITDVTTLQYPDREGRDIEINNYALPQLRTEVLDAQSAKVDAVSGATYTSEGYLSSLQAALDAAGFQS